MSYQGQSPKVNRLRFQPRNSDPVNPAEGDMQYADGSVREEGIWVYKNSAWVKVGSDQTGDINYISNGDAEAGNTAGWSLGNVTLTSSFPSGVPTFGSGASANLSFTNSSSAALAGTRSFVLASSAATTAGNFLASDAFTVDAADLAKVLSIDITYKVDSGTIDASGTNNNSFGIAIYDVTASQWIMPAGVWAITQTSGVGRAVATFQTPITSTQYRLVLFNANATSGAVSLKLDRIAVGPVSVPVGAPVTDWQRYTPIFSAGFGSVTNVNIYWRRVAGSVEIAGTFRAGTVAASAGTISLPAGLTSSSNLPAKATNYTGVGLVVPNNALASSLYAIVGGSDTTFTIGRLDGSSSGLTAIATVSSVLTSSSYCSVQVSIPIQGWSSQVQMSSDTDTRVVAATYSIAATGGAISTTNPANFDTLVYDTHGAVTVSPTAWKFTAPVAGYYEVMVTLTQASVSNILLYKNGALNQTLASPTSGVASITTGGGVQLSAGDYIDIRATTSSTVAGSGRLISIKRLSGPAVVAASETVACRYSNSASTALTGSFATIPFATKSFDTHNAYNGTTGVFTAPASGVYEVSSQVLTQGFSAGVSTFLSIFINGIEYSGATVQNTATYSAAVNPGITDQVRLNAGDQITIRGRLSVAGPGALNSSGIYNWVSIKRVGN